MRFRKWAPLISAVFVMSCFTACGSNGQTASATKIALSANGISVEGAAISTDPDDAVYLSHDTVENYGEGEGGRSPLPSVSVIHITSPGTYRIFGTMEEGQIRVDLGEKAAKDKKAVVSLILDNAHIRCSSAPAIVFESVYGGAGEETADTSAGANIILAGDSINTVQGSHGASLSEQGAVSSRMSLNIGSEGERCGTLSLTADKEGICVEDRLTVNGGSLRICAENNGILLNNGDSAAVFNGGDVHIAAGLGGEGSGIDSLGRLVINDGTVVTAVCADAGPSLRGGRGISINGGTVAALGDPPEGIETASGQASMALCFDGKKELREPIVVTDAGKNAVFAYDPGVDELLGENPRSYGGAVISCAALAEEGSYHLYLGGTLEGVESDGVYDLSADTAYTGGTEQAFLGAEEQSEDDGVLLPSGERISSSETAPPSRFVDFYLGSKVNYFFGIADR